MVTEYNHQYNALETSVDSNIDVEVSNGMLVDSNGNNIHFGYKQTGTTYNGVEDHYVDRVDGATPTGNLSVVSNEPYVDGYGAVTLTDEAGDRVVASIGGNDGNDGNIQVNPDGKIEVYYTDEYWDFKSASGFTINQSDLPVTVSQSGFDTSDFKIEYMKAALSMSADSGDECKIDYGMDLTGDGNCDDDTGTLTYDGSSDTIVDYTRNNSESYNPDIPDAPSYKVKMENYRITSGSPEWGNVDPVIGYQEYIVDEYHPSILIQ